jgi:hypothetical protein
VRLALTTQAIKWTFVIYFCHTRRDEILHQQAGLTIAPTAPTPAVRGSQQSLAVEMSPATLLPEKLAAFRDLVEVAKTDPT